MNDATNELNVLIHAIPEGWSRIELEGSSWAVTRTTRAGGTVISIDAEQLGTAEQFGANVWITEDETLLRPCEVPEEKVIRFMRAAAAAFSA